VYDQRGYFHYGNALFSFLPKNNLAVTHKSGIPDKTTEKHIKRFSVSGLVNPLAHNKYKKYN